MEIVFVDSVKGGGGDAREGTRNLWSRDEERKPN
jgi:hypothetical protein